VTQPAWWCRSCGNSELVALGYCRTCYDRHRRSAQIFGGDYEVVIRRDRCCRLCFADRPLIVHHRKPGKPHANRAPWQITLCRRCHVPIHRRHTLPGFYSDLYLELWRELHPNWPVQLRLPLAA
jgi:hypothetical protein